MSIYADIKKYTEQLESGELNWQSFALCAQTDPDAFFPELGDSNLAAKSICKVCEVQAVCLDYAVRNNEREGIWGGTTPADRRLIRRRLGLNSRRGRKSKDA